MKRLDGKKILLGVTGSIACYKSCEMLRVLQREGAEVRVTMTHAAQKFVAPLTFETLTGFNVITDLFPHHYMPRTQHIKVAEWADCILISPATANVIGKIVSGIADDILTTIVMAARSTVVIAPAMDFRMVQNPIYRENCDKLKKLGYRFIETKEGELASGAIGQGRLASRYDILDSIQSVLIGSNSLKGISVLVTAGPTQEALDPVRFISNYSSGKMGYALAEEAVLRGANVTLISGPTKLRPHSDIIVEYVHSAEQMRQAVSQVWPDHQVLIMAAAVADYRPVKKKSQKLKKDDRAWLLRLEKTIDILKDLAQYKNGRVVIGFALETENEEQQAIKKLHDKNLDLICLNNPLEENAGFHHDTNKVTLIDRNEKREELPLLPKWQVAQKIIDRIEYLLKEK